MTKEKIYNLKELKDLRRKLRKNSTPAESVLWKFLKNRQLGIKFCRQVSIKNFIVDFCSRKQKIIIELDGMIHDNKQVKQIDLFRQEQLEQLGFRFLRFKNHEIFENIDSVLDRIIHFSSHSDLKHSPPSK